MRKLLVAVVLALASMAGVAQAGTISTTKTYVCNGSTPVATTVVAHTGAGNPASVFIESGCPSGFRATVWTCTDGVHVHAGAGGTAAKLFYFHVDVHWTGRCGAVHQDGIQLMGGQHVRCMGCTTSGVLSSGSNGAWFLSEGSGGHQLPTDDICFGCFLLSNNTAVVIGHSASSGAVNSHLRGVQNGCIRISKKPDRLAVDPVLHGNICS